jgi:hypothetical protein
MNLVTPWARVSLLIATVSAALLAQTSPSQIPTRLAQEAEALAHNAAHVLTRETLEQRSLLPPTRFRPRAGSAAERATGPRFRVREVVSEFSFGALRDSPSHDLIEIRQVLSVDGKPVQSAGNALRALSQGVQQADDRSRKRILEQFARNGLVDIATDYSLIVLAFTARGQQQIEFSPSGAAFIGADLSRCYSWKQRSTQGGLTEFHGQEAVHRALQGQICLRASDGVPLRVSAWMEYTDLANRVIRDEATVDYIMSEHGFVTPASVIHRHLVNRAVVTENLYRYDPFQLFTASSTITFGSPK